MLEALSIDCSKAVYKKIQSRVWNKNVSNREYITVFRAITGRVLDLFKIDCPENKDDFFDFYLSCLKPPNPKLLSFKDRLVICNSVTDLAAQLCNDLPQRSVERRVCTALLCSLKNSQLEFLDLHLGADRQAKARRDLEYLKKNQTLPVVSYVSNCHHIFFFFF